MVNKTNENVCSYPSDDSCEAGVQVTCVLCHSPAKRSRGDFLHYSSSSRPASQRVNEKATAASASKISAVVKVMPRSRSNAP